MARESAESRLQRMIQVESPLWNEGLLPGGVDEAGRGPLAGPVVAACVVMPKENLLLGVNDSKKLSQLRRETLFEQIQETALAVGVGIADVERIGEMGIRHASRWAMEQAILLAKPDWALVDYEQGLGVCVPQQGIVHGDAVSYLIACASIVAKVTRDRMMLQLDEQYPGYGFAAHKGYGTAAHVQAILRQGPCPAHRPLFLRKILEKGQ